MKRILVFILLCLTVGASPALASVISSGSHPAASRMQRRRLPKRRHTLRLVARETSVAKSTAAKAVEFITVHAPVRKAPPTKTTTTTTTTTSTVPVTTTTATTTTPTTTTTTTTTSTTPTVQTPTQDPSAWSLAFDDEFNGTSLDTSRWVALNGYAVNNVTTSAANVSVSGGYLNLKLASSTSGAEVDSSPADGAGANGYLLPVGGFVEASIDFPGSGATIYNWPAFWVSGPGWPAAGENDIAEGLGTLTVNYHSPAGALNTGTVPGNWANGFHTYALYRGSDYCNVYYDGTLVRTYPTDDNGQPEAILINIGAANTPVYGAASTVKVDWVRAYAPVG